MKGGQVTVSGVVKHSKLEGGFWVLEGDDGQRYQLDGGGGGLYRNGARARVTGRIATDAVGLAMRGDILRVESYEIG